MGAISPIKTMIKTLFMSKESIMILPISNRLSRIIILPSTLMKSKLLLYVGSTLLNMIYMESYRGLPPGKLGCIRKL